MSQGNLLGIDNLLKKGCISRLFNWGRQSQSRKLNYVIFEPTKREEKLKLNT